ncbi:hypothetical protein [Hymenobacter ruricola]|uniref:Uncharacterized protein n=1 Tax=Hymenobacter ruricola TaxID=2791023 RepID=A0ABS0I6A3_9BACT|nr:hypothetical protein [Hymenobacter ruricola]MBF9222507.1 hypothetical protein [Hymenobacter ruricola]
MPQVCIYPKDAAQLTGTQYGTGKRLLQRIRTALHKPARAYVSVAEFCQFTGLPEAEVNAALNSAPALPRQRPA